MFHDVRVVVNSGTVTVTNRQTGGVIFSGQLNDLASGTFHPENMPAGPGTTSGATLYAVIAAPATGRLPRAPRKDATADAIQSAITNNVGGMGKFSNLTATADPGYCRSISGHHAAACSVHLYLFFLGMHASQTTHRQETCCHRLLPDALEHRSCRRPASLCRRQRPAPPSRTRPGEPASPTTRRPEP